MAHIYTTDGVVLAKVMRDFLNTWGGKPCSFQYETLGDPVSIMLQPLAAAEVVKSYINGSYIGIWNFRVVVRVAGEDTAQRFDAYGILGDLDNWLEEKSDDGSYIHLPIIDGERTATSIVLTTNPSLAARYENGTEDYQAVFQLEYKARRK